MYANIEDYKKKLVGQKVQCLVTCIGDYSIHFYEEFVITINNHAAFWRVVNDNDIIASSYDFVLRTTDETFDDHDYMSLEVAKLYEESAGTDNEIFYNEALSQYVDNKLDALNKLIEDCIVEDIEIKDGDLHLRLTNGIVIDIFKAYSESCKMKPYTFQDRRKK